jgi:hypothetical protein
MEGLPRAIIAAALIFGSALLVHGLYPADRYTIAAAAGGGSYRLDRLTGTVYFCDSVFCRALPLAVPVGVGAPAVPAKPKVAPPSGATGT